MATEKVINHFCHEHPLLLRENSDPDLNCYACEKPIGLESAYVCVDYKYCSHKSRNIFHKTCAELPKQFTHPSHPQHPLHLFQDQQVPSYTCNLCRRIFETVLRYRCHSCDFDVDITCEKLGMDELFGETRSLAHVNHIHPLTLARKPTSLFCCDGCGSQDWDMAYTCSTCDFWVHKTCALLPASLPTDRHHHRLTLASCLPIKHRKYRYQCGVCDKNFNTACWVYFCGDCRYFAHLKCVTSPTCTAQLDSNIEEGDDHGSNVVEFPLYAHDISKELITPFVMREKDLNMIPNVTDMPTTVNMPQTTASFSFLFNYHKHHLSLVAEPHDDNKITHEEDEDEATNDELKICDVCVTPISSPPYYECASCKYFIHSICYLLPKTFSSSSSPNLYGECPKTHDKNHRFTLYTSSEFTDMDSWLCKCELCGFITNGMFYECEGCEMKIDVKCASLPTTIRHTSHPHHKPLILSRIPLAGEGGTRKKCHGCDSYNNVAYCCSSDDCNFALDLKCAMLPASITMPEWDRYHPLMLSFDASLDHPSDFICDFCEGEMHPKGWMYHCRHCDLSFHLFCLKTASGWYRNIKFGRQFVLDGIHPNHPLTFNCVTIKRRCDICHSVKYDFGGLECASCYYLVCIICAWRELAKKV